MDAAPAEATAPMYDISGAEPVLGDMPHSQIHDAVSSGQFSFPKGQEVAVVSPDGTHGTVPAEQAPDAFKNGYQYATPDMVSAQSDQDKYNTKPQQFAAALEGAAQGVAGPLAPLAEKMFGVNPEGIRKRAEMFPKTHGVAEAAGFGAGLFTGASEASLVGKAGEAVAAATKLGGEGAGITSRLAAGAVKAGTELSIIQAGDEVTKVITNAPTSIGDAAINIGLAGLLGGVTGGALSGVGMAAKAGYKAAGLDTALKEFTDRLAYRGANLNPNEAMQKEAEDAVNAFHSMGSEIGGANGMKSQALKNIMPKTLTPAISEQAQGVATKSQSALNKMQQSGAPDRLMAKFTTDVNELQDVLTNPAASVGEHFDAMNEFKGKLQAYSKGNWGPFAVPTHHEAYDFLNITKGLAHEVRTGLEDPAVWGKPVADLQTNLNKAWSAAIPAVKDVESKFMSQVGNDRIVDPAKFNTYVSQNGRATSQTIRQQMMGKFIDAMEKFHAATAEVYEKAGVPNPHPPIGLGALKDSIEKKNPWARLADLTYDRMAHQGLGDIAGGVVGGAIGHATGIPEAGFVGGYLGKWALGPVFSAIIKPVMTKSLNSGALQTAVKFSQDVIKGNSQLIKSSADLFAAAGKTIPQHMVPDENSRAKLTKSLEYAQANPSAMFNVGADLGHYMPDHQTALAQHAQGAVTYLNSLRPQNPQKSPLDAKVPPSKAQMSSYNRALDIADQPLLAIQHIKQGTLLPQDIATIKTIYPALYDKMSQQLMSSMTDHLAKDGAVPYRMRQSLSMFLGQPLDSTMTPESISSIQASYQSKQAAPQPPQGAPAKKSTSKLGHLATGTQTANQAREQRLNKA